MDIKNNKILVVDDSLIVRVTLSKILKANKFSVEVAEDGNEALKKCNEIPNIWLIISDMNMPGLTGLELIKKLNQKFEIPIIILTGNSEISLVIEAINNGASDYLLKDGNIKDTVLLSVNRILEKQRMKEENLLLMKNLGKKNSELEESQKSLEKSNAFIRQTFGRYLSDEIVDNLLEHPEGLRLGGEKRKVTIMMADLRGFTAVAEQLEAEKVVTMINNFLGPMTEIIQKHGGTIDEFIGDAILAIFGAPLTNGDDTERAIACAVEMQMGMYDVNKKNKSEGLPEVASGIGLNTGNVVVGNIGSEKRTKYGIVGRHVNLTSRVESYTVGGQIFISEFTYNDVDIDIRVDGKMVVEPKGVKEPITIYEIGGIGGKYNLYLPEKADEILYVLDKGLNITFKVLSGKDIGDQVETGTFLNLGVKGALMRAGAAIQNLDNLKISINKEDGTLVTNELYSKVVKGHEKDTNCHRIIFTSIPKEAEDFLQQTIKN